jgi:hypothetical protein
MPKQRCLDRVQPHSGYGPQDKPTAGYHFWCPGCDMHHGVYIRVWRPGGNPVWTFNGNLEKPTFTPSILVTMPIEGEKPKICHSFVTDGRIQFLGDCTHALAGKTVDLPLKSDWRY